MDRCWTGVGLAQDLVAEAMTWTKWTCTSTTNESVTRSIDFD
jgi:hypothetical protein